jgi:hypothetical protein
VPIDSISPNPNSLPARILFTHALDAPIHEIAAFAGHRSIQTTLLYIHLSGRDLSAKLAATMAQIHARRIQMLAEMNV